MKSRSTLFFLGTSALTGALLAGSSLEGCRGDSSGVGTGASAGAGATSATSGKGSTSAATTGAGGSSSALDVTIPEITDPTNPGYVTGVQVKLTGVVAMSIKFLVSKSSTSGACLWGVFVSTGGLQTTGPNTGLLVVNDGATATTSGDAGKAYCPVYQAGMKAGDLFPDDTAPGDVFDIVGETGSYVPSTCGAPDAGPPDNSNVPQYQLSKLSKVTRTKQGGPVPTPAVITAAEAMAIAGGTDKTTLDQWGGVKVTVENVSAVLQGGATFDAYGHLLLDDGIQVGDKLYYVGYVKTTDVCYAGPTFPSTIPSFTSVSGFVYLDFCTWGLDPADKCHDFAPPSDDCESVVDGGADASASMVCLH